MKKIPKNRIRIRQVTAIAIVALLVLGIISIPLQLFLTSI